MLHYKIWIILCKKSNKLPLVSVWVWLLLMFYLIWFRGHQTQTRGVGHLPDALLLISSPNFDICLSVNPRLNNQLSYTRVAYVTLQTGVLISRRWINMFFVMSAFSVERKNPEISFYRVWKKSFFICASFWQIHYFVILLYCISVVNFPIAFKIFWI